MFLALAEERGIPWEKLRGSVQNDSSLGGADLTLGKPLIDAARREKLMDGVVFVIGGVFSPDDTVRLKEIGFDAIQYLTVVRQSAILSGIRSCK